MPANVTTGSVTVALLLAAGLAGCTLREEPPQLLAPLPTSWAAGATATTPTRPAEFEEWWRRYRDPALTALVDKALGANPTIEEATQRIQAARALARAENALRFPLTTGAGSVTITTRLSGPIEGLNAAGEDAGQGPRRTVGQYDGALDTTWELDLFGRLRAQVAAAERNAAASVEDLEAVRISLAADVVRAYVELRSAQRRRAVVQADIAARSRLLDLVRSQRVAGLAGEFDVERANATFEAARARLPVAELGVRTAQQRLATLVGEPTPASALLRGPRPFPVLAAPGPTLPADLLRMRPDIRRAEVVVAQRAAQADVAFADLFPRFVLGGSLTIQGNVLAMPIAGTPVTLSGGPGVTVPLFDWGQRRAVLNAREAELKEAIAAYRRVVLLAVEDVQVALSAVRQTAQRVVRLRTAVEAADRALTSAERLYREGATGLTERLQAETDLRSAQFDLAEASEAAALAMVSLYRGLGAGPRRLPERRPPTEALPAPSSLVLARDQVP